MDKATKMILFSLLLADVCSLVFCEEWKAKVVNNLEALVDSCVVVPCSFSHPRGTLPTSRLRGIWHHKSNKNQIIYHSDDSKIKDSFKERTKLLGALGQSNCTLEIMPVKDHDNGPFCFRIELVKTDNNDPTTDMFSFVEDCVEIPMLHEPPKPKMGPLKTAIIGKPYTVMCSVHHTCPSHMPVLTWNKGAKEDVIHIHKDLHNGKWEMASVLMFIPQEGDDDTELTCTAVFHEGLSSLTSLKLNVKNVQNYNHIIIPIAVTLATALLFGGLFVFMMKKYNMWNRMSRMSRSYIILTHSPNNAVSKSCGEQNVSKPRLPSPKSQPKSYNYNEDLGDDDYMNTADLNIYGNV
uniref:Myelin-associated glycoprotein-like n=1 Tax=Kryptolebias marmoratus TaxID=37003 RepID=A0A3Q3BHU0_KRYMA